MNFVRIRWRSRWNIPKKDLVHVILHDNNLTWAAKGLGVYLTTTKEGVRFPNCIYDGTMDALQNLADYGYVNVMSIEDEETQDN